VLASYLTAAEAAMVKELLEENGIPTVLRGQIDPLGVVSGAARTELLVDERDLARALELYEAFYESESSEATEVNDE
jgi:hypothetical protein